jgi:hypothetical protein
MTTPVTRHNGKRTSANVIEPAEENRLPLLNSSTVDKHRICYEEVVRAL